jgi:hypothetical protein
MFYAGPFGARHQDTLGLAVGRTRVNPRVAEGQRLLNSTGTSAPVPVQDAEYPVELFYNIHFTPWLSFAPLLQYVIHPGGTNVYPDVGRLRSSGKPEVGARFGTYFHPQRVRIRLTQALTSSLNG